MQLVRSLHRHASHGTDLMCVLKTVSIVSQGFYFSGDGCRRDEDGYYWITYTPCDFFRIPKHNPHVLDCLLFALIGHSRALKRPESGGTPAPAAEICCRLKAAACSGIPLEEPETAPSEMLKITRLSCTAAGVWTT